MALSIAEVLEDVAKAKTREDKRDVLKKNDSWSLKALLQQNFHSTIPHCLIRLYLLTYWWIEFLGAASARYGAPYSRLF